MHYNGYAELISILYFMTKVQSFAGGGSLSNSYPLTNNNDLICMILLK